MLVGTQKLRNDTFSMTPSQVKCSSSAATGPAKIVRKSTFRKTSETQRNKVFLVTLGNLSVNISSEKYFRVSLPLQTFYLGKECEITCLIED